MRLRNYEFDLTLFESGAIERVSIMAPNRAYGFTRAAQQSTDPNNVWKVRLVRENGRELDPYDLREWKVPPAHDSSKMLSTEWRNTPRTYNVDFVLFGGAEDYEQPSAVGRINAFTEAVLDTTTPDGVMEVALSAVCDENDIGYVTDGNKEYGGVTFDLDDLVESPDYRIVT